MTWHSHRNYQHPASADSNDTHLPFQACSCGTRTSFPHPQTLQVVDFLRNLSPLRSIPGQTASEGVDTVNTPVWSSLQCQPLAV